jgi:hypothetical protein
MEQYAIYNVRKINMCMFLPKSVLLNARLLQSCKIETALLVIQEPTFRIINVRRLAQRRATRRKEINFAIVATQVVKIAVGRAKRIA